MKAPKCKICGKEHYGICSFKAEKLEEGGDREAGRDVRAQPDSADIPGRRADQPRAKPVVEKPSLPGKPKFDRNAYQRDLMRKRRAAAKARNERS